MNYAEWAKANKVKLELSPFRSNCWRKFKDGKMHYFSHPQTKEGYQAALEEWILLKSQLSSERPNAQVYHHHQKLFGKVIEYYDAFGTPPDERQIRIQVIKFLELVEAKLAEPVLEPKISMAHFFLTGFHEAFLKEFMSDPTLGTVDFNLPPKWLDRIARMTPAKQEKTPQTIDYWVKAYLANVKERVDRNIRKKSADNRGHKLKPFKDYADLQAHISIINEEYVTAYHRHLDDKLLAKESKKGYFSTFRMFVGWCAKQKQCDLTAPANLDSKEFGFREPMGTGRKRLEKKKLLWSKEEFDNALELPPHYRCFCLLMLNCGFRHIDISELLHDDIHWDENRIVIQRNKLNQQDRSPVISYPLWKKTIEAIKETMTDPSEDDIVFRNESGGQVEGSIKTWWHRHAKDYELSGKRLDMLRKTGSTIIARYNQHLDEMYLGESLSTVAKIHYSFTDGEPCLPLDKAIQHLGAQFGLAKEPTKTIEVTPQIAKLLKKHKIKV